MSLSIHPINTNKMQDIAKNIDKTGHTGRKEGREGGRKKESNQQVVTNREEKKTRMYTLIWLLF